MLLNDYVFFLIWYYDTTSAHYFTLPFILLDPPRDERSNHKGQLWPREAVSLHRGNEKQGLLCVDSGMERRKGHTRLSRLLLAQVFVMNGEKSKSGKQELVFGPLKMEENSKRNLQEGSFG